MPVGRFFGVPLYFSLSWLIIAALITYSYAGTIASNIPDLSRGMEYLLAFGFAVLLALSVLLHEIGHTAVSLALGHKVNRVVIFLLGGVSEIDREPARPRDELVISVTGPVVSAALAALCWWGLTLTTPHTVLSTTLALLAVSNAVIAVFNVLPGLPLDGGRVVRAVVWAITGRRVTGTKVAAWAGRAVAVGFVVVVLYLDWQSRSLSTVGFTVLLAAFIWMGATQSLRLAQLQDRVPGLQLGQLVRPAVVVSATTPVAEALRRSWDSGARAIVVVDGTGTAQALVDERRLGSLPVERRPWVPVADIARPLEPGLILPETLDGELLLEAVQAHPAGEYLVVRVDGSMVGVLAAADLATRLDSRSPAVTGVPL